VGLLQFQTGSSWASISGLAESDSPGVKEVLATGSGPGQGRAVLPVREECGALEINTLGPGGKALL